jgi:hypothetical protein
MRAFVVTGPARSQVAEVSAPVPGPGQVVVDTRPLVAATVGLADVGKVLTGWRPAGAGPGPKIHVDPRL